VLVIDSAQLRIPFNDPRRTSVEGTAKIEGFDAHDTLNGLNDTKLTLGLSADQIYFELAGTGEPVPLPAIAGYSHGAVSLSQLSVGYGFTHNSLAMSFAGELKLPDGLAQDADTSTRLGFGVRLPEYTRLAFRLDLIPIPGPIPVAPEFEFSLDMRSPGAPALRATQVCAPAYDGLQFNIPGLIHTDIKAFAVSPMFGIVPAPNLHFDGDLDLGNERFGLTLISDELLVILGIGAAPTPHSIPMLADPTAPYFDHLCVNARFAGFGVNFDLERPFPRPSPLLAFEVLGLIADPMRPIDPNGALARSIRMALKDAYVSIPAWARPLIPGGRELVRHELDIEIDVGTLIAAVQWTARVAGESFRQMQQALDAGQAALQQLAAHPPRVDVEELLALLPPELRTFDCELSFAGFDASATIILASVTASPAPRPRVPTPVAPSRQGIGILPVAFRPLFIGPQSTAPPISTAPTVGSALLHLPALSEFGAGDLGALPPPKANVDTVLVAAQVRVLNAQSYGFLGWLASDGRFGLITKLDVAPLSLAIAGITIRLPLALEGRLQLEGRVASGERYAALAVSGRGRWDAIPGVIRVTAGARQPVELAVDTRGHFSLRGSGSVELLGLAGLRIDGSLDASEAHLALAGALHFSLGADARSPVLQLDAEVACRIGPVPTFDVAGQGTLRLFNLRVADVAVRVSDREVALRAQIEPTDWRLVPLQFDTRVHGDMEGRILFSSNAGPELRLQGKGALQVLGATLEGALDVRSDAATTRIGAEGRLMWFGRDWLAGRIAIDASKGVDLFGRVSVVLDLTPDHLPAGIEIGRLFLRAELGGRFSFGANRQLSAHDLLIDWTLGIRLPGGAPNQTFVLAMQKLSIANRGAPDHELINVQGFTFVPLGNVVVPIPTITPAGSEELDSVKIHAPVLDQVPFLMTRGMKDAIVPGLHNLGITVDSQPLFDVPTSLKLGTKDFSLGELAAAMSFRVRLQWRNDDFGFEVRRGNDAKFISLTQLA
jgi:hypothetical protein